MLAVLVLAACSERPWPGADEPAWGSPVAPDSADSQARPDTSDSASPGDSGEIDPPPPFHYLVSPDLRVTAYGSAGEFGDALDGTGDFNADGVSDLAVFSKSDDWGGRDVGAVFIYFGPLAGSRRAIDADATLLGTGGLGIGRMEVLADLDGDGGSELRTGHEDTGRLILSSVIAAGGSVDPALGVALPWSTSDPAAAWDDVDGDGVPEVITTDPDYDVTDFYDFNCGQVRLLDGADFLFGVATPLHDTASYHYTDYEGLGGDIVLLDDRDGDSLREIATTDDSGTVVLSSALMLADEYAVIQDIDAGLLAPAGDTDGDGLGDLIVGVSGNLAIATAAAGESVDAASLAALGATDGTAWSAHALGDPDGDGDEDLAVSILASDGYHVTRVDTQEISAGGSIALADRDLDVGPLDEVHVSGAPDGGVWLRSEENEPWARVVSGFAFSTDKRTLGDANASVRAEGPYLKVSGDYANWVDVDGDGLPELLLQASYPEGWALVPGGVVARGGTWGACDAGCFATPGFTGVLDDLDGDGLVEVYVASDSAIHRYPLAHLSTGAEAPLAEYTGTLYRYFGRLGAADVNGDGRPDPSGSSFVTDGARLLGSFSTDALLASLASDLRSLGDIDGDGRSEVSTWRGIYAGADLHDGVTEEDVAPLFDYTAPVQDPLSTPADADGDGLADTPLSFEEACGWLKGVPTSTTTVTDLAAGVAGVGGCDGAWLVPGDNPQWLVASYNEPARELRAWRFVGPRLYLLDEARIALDLSGVASLQVQLDPVDGDGLAILVGREDETTLAESLELHRYP